MDNTFEIKSKDYSTFIIWTNSAIAGLAIMIIAGWMLHFSPFKILFPTSISMKFNTAFCFILLTLSLLIRLAYQNKFLSQLSNWLLFTVLQVGILSFIEDKFKLDFGIDEFFSKDYEAANEKLLYPGRMSPLTAICFTCISISMLGLQTRKNGFIQFIQSLFHFVTLLSFVAILGYVFNVPTFYKLSYVTSMAVHTAVAFFFFSIALSLLNPTKGITGLFTGNGIGNMMARKLFLQITCFSVLLAYIRILTHKYGILNVEFGIALFAFSFILLSLLLIWKTSQELNTIDLKRKEVEINLLEIKTFLDSTPYPMLIINENGGIEEVNEQAKKAFGYLNAELIGEAIDKLIPERFLENYTAKLNALYTTPTIRSIGMDIDFFLSKKDGTEFPAEIYLNTIKYGEQLWVSAAIWDISERKEKEKKIREISFRLQLATSKAGVGIWEYNVVNNILTWDDIMYKLYGIPEEKFSGTYDAWRNVLHKDDVERTEHEIQLALKNLKAFDTSFRVVWKDGAVHHIKAKALIEKDEWGNPIRMIGTNWDITDQKEAEEKLKQFEIIIDSSADAIISKKLDGTILTWNSGAEKIFGFTAQEMLGKHISTLFPPELILEEKVLMDMILQGEHIAQYETIRMKKDGKKIFVSITLSPIKDVMGNIIGVSNVARDITKNKELEGTLVQLSILEAKSKEMEQFTYIASHDLRHPLLTILSYAKILNEDYREALNDEAKRCLRSITGAAERMDKLILGLLDYSRLSKMKQLQDVDCNELMSQVLADLKSMINTSHATITVNELPVLKAYPLELKQLFQNLVTNALKFKKKNTPPELIISAKKNRDEYCFEFRDNGIGIQEKDFQKIFLIFQRLHSKDEYEGTGLGLSFCKKIVELHRGEIWVESVPEKGSSFYFTINPTTT